MQPLTPETQRRLEILFAPEQREAARVKLETDCANNLPFCEKLDPVGLERIRFAVLKLSAGGLANLAREIAQAQCDWRDTLMAAGFGHDVNAHQRWFPEPPG